MNCLRCFCCVIKFMSSVIKLGCKRCTGWKRQAKMFLLSVKISCLGCFCCVLSVSDFFLRYGQGMWVVLVVLNKSVDFLNAL